MKEVTGIICKEDFFYWLKTAKCGYLIINPEPEAIGYLYQVDDSMLGSNYAGVIDESEESLKAFDSITIFKEKYKHLNLQGNIHLKNKHRN